MIRGVAVVSARGASFSAQTVSASTRRLLSARPFSGAIFSVTTAAPCRALLAVTARRHSSTESAGSKDGGDSEAGAASGAAASPAADDAAKAEIAKLQKEIKEMKDQVLRSYAEEENVRRIAKKDVESARQYANQSFAKAMLEIGDNLERALEAVPKQVKEDLKAGKGEALSAQLAKELVVGIEMTEKGLQKTFNSFGVVRFGALGDAFDPALHDALFQAPSPDKTNNTISAVLKTGYKLKDRVIRPAQVGVVANP